MRKFVTLTLAFFAVSLFSSASSKLPFKETFGDNKEVFTKSDEPLPHNFSTSKNIKAYSDSELPELSNAYFDVYIDDDLNALCGDRITFIKTASSDNGDSYIMSGFLKSWMGYVEDIEVRFVPANLSGFDKPTLFIPCESVLYNFKDEAIFKLYLMTEIGENQYKFYYDTDIPLVYNEAENKFEIPFPEDFIGYVYEYEGKLHGNGIGNQITTLYAPNGKMTYDGYNNGNFLPMQCDVFSYQNDKDIYVYGFASAEIAVDFVINSSSGSAVVNNQIALYNLLYDKEGNYTKGENFTWQNVASKEYQLNASVKNDGNKGVITLTDGEIWAFSEVVDTYLKGTWMKNARVTLDYNISNIDASVGDIIADDSSQEPVYYNLQGIEIKNPAAGQIVIKKDNTGVHKIKI